VKRIYLDTNVLIDWINAGLHEGVILGSGYVRYLSAVVLMELTVGARTPGAKRALARIERGFVAGGRLLVPTRENFREAGQVLRSLKLRSTETRRSSLVNDVLIAMSARSAGAAVVTSDSGDFEAIRAVRRFDLMILPR
jgi:predicted nucleic acid-binding protein